MDNLLTVFTQRDAEEAWRYLDDSLDLIAIRQIQNLSFQELYNRAYKLVINKYGNYAYENLKEKIIKVFKGLIRKIQDSHKDIFLHNLVVVWQDINFITALMSDIFLYMDKNFIPKEKKKSIRLLCLDTFRRLQFEENLELSQRLIQIMLEEIRLDRDGEVIERTLLKNAIAILVSHINIQTSCQLDIDQVCNMTPNYTNNPLFYYSQSDRFYKQFFEIKLVKETQKYFNEESQRMIKILSVEEYLVFCRKRLESEMDRVKSYLYSSSEKPIRDAFIQFMITNQAHLCISAENRGNSLMYFLDLGQSNNLIEMYQLFLQSSQSFELFLDGISKYILGKGCQILQDRRQVNADENNQLLEQLIELHEQFEEHQKLFFIQGSKNQQQQLSRIIQDAFEQVVNQDIYVTVQLNKNLDLCFRRDFKTLFTEEAENKLKRNFNIFRLIKQKDVFESHYRNLLSRRLIDGTSISDEFERIFVSQMKRECGCSFTSKIETMFKDMEISKIELVEFKKNIRNITQQPTIIDLEFYVLTMGHWPLQDPIIFIIPEELRFWRNSFEKYYIQRNRQRKLNWHHNLGFVEIKAHYLLGKKKEFTTTTLQACILLLFNGDHSLDINELALKLEVGVDHLKREIAPLVQIQILLLRADTPESASYTRNADFQHKSYKLKLTLNDNRPKTALKQPQPMEEEELLEEVIVERKFVIESLIVRIMKSRKILDHSKLVELVVELAQQRHFVPDSGIIKKAIESLMSRDYLERNDENKNYYLYKA